MKHLVIFAAPVIGFSGPGWGGAGSVRLAGGVTRRPDPSFNRRIGRRGVAVQGNSLSGSPPTLVATVRQHEVTDAFQAGAFCAERSQAEPAPGVVADKSHCHAGRGLPGSQVCVWLSPEPQPPTARPALRESARPYRRRSVSSVRTGSGMALDQQVRACSSVVRAAGLILVGRGFDPHRVTTVASTVDR